VNVGKHSRIGLRFVVKQKKQDSVGLFDRALQVDASMVRRVQAVLDSIDKRDQPVTSTVVVLPKK
jgi:hypothetical protein